MGACSNKWARFYWSKTSRHYHHTTRHIHSVIILWRPPTAGGTWLWGVKVWRNSQLLFQGHDSIDHIPNASRKLRKHDGGWGKKANLHEFNCVVFDSRLIHESLAHTQLTPRASLTFYLRFKGSPHINDADVSNYLKPEECGMINMQEYL